MPQKYEISLVQYIPETLDEGIIYISKEYEVSVHLCVCGCKNKTVLPFDEKYGWKLTINDDKVTFRPSISNYNFSCKSHYYITDNQIEML